MVLLELVNFSELYVVYLMTVSMAQTIQRSIADWLNQQQI